MNGNESLLGDALLWLSLVALAVGVVVGVVHGNMDVIAWLLIVCAPAAVFFGGRLLAGLFRGRP